jgi:hypothetical protein
MKAEAVGIHGFVNLLLILAGKKKTGVECIFSCYLLIKLFGKLP